MKNSKPYKIPKQAVWTAYKKVKANKGSAGIDGINFEKYEENLKDNLYKVWNRMSSGSYIPKAVKAVEILKKNGGTRRLGIPTITCGHWSKTERMQAGTASRENENCLLSSGEQEGRTDAEGQD